MYTAETVAEYAIRYANYIAKYRNMSNLRLQKILYFIQIKSLGVKGKKMFYEDMVAWDFGPVCLPVYRRFMYFGLMSLWIDGVFLDDNMLENIKKSDKKIIESVIDACEGYSNSFLVDACHKSKPWRKNYVAGFDNVIPVSDMREEAERLMPKKENQGNGSALKEIIKKFIEQL